LFSGFISESTVPASSFAKASLEGAKAVKGLRLAGFDKIRGLNGDPKAWCDRPNF
jgi:hypothetical protein